MVGAAGQGPAGELAVPLPAGFVRRPSGEVALDPGEDPQVSKPPVVRIADRVKAGAGAVFRPRSSVQAYWKVLAYLERSCYFLV